MMEFPLGRKLEKIEIEERVDKRLNARVIQRINCSVEWSFSQMSALLNSALSFNESTFKTVFDFCILGMTSMSVMHWLYSEICSQKT